MSDQEFSMFSFGVGNVPRMFRSLIEQPGGGERLAKLVIDGSIGKKVPPDYLRTVAQLLVEYYGNLEDPMPSYALKANAAALSQLSPDKEGSLPASWIRRLMGLPNNVAIDQFLDAAGRDAIALAFSLQGEPDLEVEKLSHLIQIEDWAISERALANAVKVSRSAINSHRSKSEYRHFVEAVGGWCLISLWCNDAGRSLSRVEIRTAVSNLSKPYVLAFVDTVPLVG